MEIQFKTKVFGSLAEHTSHSTPEVSVPKGTDTAGLQKILEEKYPGLKGKVYRISVNKKITDGPEKLNSGDEIALLPPFAGG